MTTRPWRRSIMPGRKAFVVHLQRESALRTPGDSSHRRSGPGSKGARGVLSSVSWPWVPAWGSLEPPCRDGENAQKMGKNGGKLGEIWPKKCEQGKDGKDHLQVERVLGRHRHAEAVVHPIPHRECRVAVDDRHRRVDGVVKMVKVLAQARVEGEVVARHVLHRAGAEDAHAVDAHPARNVAGALARAAAPSNSWVVAAYPLLHSICANRK